MPGTSVPTDRISIRSRYVAETTAILRDRLPAMVLTFFLTFLGIWIVEYQAHRERIAIYGVCFAIAITVQVICVWISRRYTLSPTASVGISLLVAFIVLTGMTVYELTVDGEAEVLALGHVYVLVGSMVFLPWEAWAQALLVIASQALYLIAIGLGLHSVAPVGMLVIGLAGIGILTVGSANRSGHYRFNAFRQAAELAEINAELQLANHALSEANRAKAHCLANVSHEFRTPLNVIIGFAQLAEEGALGELSGEAHSALRSVLSNSWMLLGLVNDFLDFARLEANRLTLRMERVAVTPLCAEAAELVEPLLSGKPVQLGWWAGDDFIVHADRARLRQVLVNLLTNATKFTERGAVRVSAHRVDDDWGVIQVSDTGCGIRRAELDFIFEPFRRGSTAERIGGVGIGLGLARQLAEAMGGSLTVDSEIGVGSTFTVRLALREHGTGHAPDLAVAG